MRPFLLLCLLASLLPAAARPAPRPTPARQAILSTLARQTTNWNAGRINDFMTGYWPSDSLTFVSKNGITYGYAATLANYQKRYPDRQSMGTLAFTILKLDLLGPTTAYVIGQWQLTRPAVGNAGGHFTLLWKKLNGRWLIVSDHSS